MISAATRAKKGLDEAYPRARKTKALIEEMRKVATEREMDKPSLPNEYDLHRDCRNDK